MNKFKTVLGIASLAACFAVNASTFIQGVKVEPAEIKAGQTAKITISGTEGDTVNCGVKLHFGDGTSQDFKLVNKGMLPLVVEHKYDKAGELKVLAEPKKVTSHFKCGGQNQTATLKVVAPPAPVVAPAPIAKAPVVAAPVAAAPAAPGAAPVKPAPKATGPACPEGWNLDAKTVNKKTGSYSCTAKVGAKLPDAKLSCAKGLGYYENADKGLIGCRP
jgi:hypothetical protein